MRILIIVDCYYPSTKSGAKLIHDLGVELYRQGHQITILTPSERNIFDLELTTEDGLQIARIKNGQLKGVSKCRRALREIRLSRTLWKKGEDFFRANPHDLIIFYSPSIFFGDLVRRLKMLWDCRAYLILRDIFPQWAVDAGLMRKGPTYHFFRWKEIRQYQAADIIGVQSPANLDYFTAMSLRRQFNLEVLYNWTVPDEAPKPSLTYRQQLGLHDKVVFFYGGNIGVAQDMDNILRLAERMQCEPRAHFLLVGEGSEVERLQELILTNGLTNIQILPAVGQEEYLAMLSEFDVGLISLDRRLKTQNFPGKLLGYMSCAKPVLCSVNPGNDLKTMIEWHQAGLCSINGDDDAFLSHALLLARDELLRRRLGRNSRLLLDRNFSVSNIATQIIGHFTQVPVFQPADEMEQMLEIDTSVKAG